MQDPTLSFTETIAPHPKAGAPLPYEGGLTDVKVKTEGDELVQELAQHLQDNEPPPPPDSTKQPRTCFVDPPVCFTKTSCAPVRYHGELDAYTLIGSLTGTFAIGIGTGLLLYWAFSGPSAGITCGPPTSSL